MRSLIISLLISFCLTGAAFAEGMSDKAYTSVLLELNKMRPDQNPGVSLGRNQLHARIMDKNLRTIGKVQDIIVTPEGKYETILTNIGTTGFREDVAFDVASYVISPTADSFTVSLDKDQLKQNMPQLIAATHTASGTEGPFSIKSLQDGKIYKSDGATIAKVKDVLVDSKAMQVVSLLVTISSGNSRGRTLAIPYEASSAKLEGGKAVLTVTDAQAATMESMATKRY